MSSCSSPPPFVPSHEQDAWLLRSIDAAFSCGASVVSLVPTRPDNGAIEALAASGWFRAPVLDDIERSFALALSHAQGRGRVFVDLWDVERFAQCQHCTAARRDRLHAMNLEQRVPPPRPCPSGDQFGCGPARHVLETRIDRAIEPFDTAGLLDRARRDRYPVVAADLIASAAKLDATPGEMLRLLERTGMVPAAART